MRAGFHLLCCAALVAGCGRRDASTSTPEPSAAAKTLARQLATALPGGWSVPAIRESAEPGKEGIYIHASNPGVELDDPKGQHHPCVDLYFRPKAATTECYETQMDGSIYSMHLGHTPKYDVYGGSVGVDLVDEIREAMALNPPQNERMEP